MANGDQPSNVPPESIVDPGGFWLDFQTGDQRGEVQSSENILIR